MKIRILVLAIAMASFNSYAKDQFTPEQQAEIERLISVRIEQALAAERQKILEEVLASISSKDPEDQSASERVTQPQANPPQSAQSLTTSTIPEDKGRPLEQNAFDGKRSRVPVDRALAVPTPTFQLDFKQDKAQASFLIGRSVDGVSQEIKNTDELGSGPEVKSRSTSWSLNLSAPIDDAENSRSNFATLDGFSPGLSATYTYAWHSSDTLFLWGLDENEDWQSLCKDFKPSPDECTYQRLLEQAETNSALSEKLTAFYKKHLGSARSYALTAKANRAKFAYFDLNRQKQTDREIEWGVGASFYWTPSSRRRMFGFGADVLRKKEAGKQSIICPPASSQPTVCQQGALTPPKDQNRTIAWGEYRSDAWGFPFSLKVSHDLDSGENAFDLPIFLVRRADGLFSGGVRLGWNEEEDFDIGIFVSTPLTLSTKK
jgi:hypothetical protein